MRTQIDLYRKQARWETLKAVAIIIGAAAAMMSATLALAVFLAPHLR
jgi:hypothetical protein